MTQFLTDDTPPSLVALLSSLCHLKLLSDDPDFLLPIVDCKEYWAEGFNYQHQNTWIDAVRKGSAQEDEEEEEEEAGWEAVYAGAKSHKDSFRTGIQSNARFPLSAGVEDAWNARLCH